ncbi:MAG: hypothetical protein K6C08_00895 [Oscillospiraceae bacterium]|nr:hypothetical protein [Oscillospiraceae bacterium]
MTRKQCAVFTAVLLLSVLLLTACGIKTGSAVVQPETAAAPTPVPVYTPSAAPTPAPTGSSVQMPSPSQNPAAGTGNQAVISTPAPVTTSGPIQTAVPTAAATPVPAATPAVSAQTTAGYPVVTKHPTGETVKAGGSCQFIARYKDAKWAVWHFTSPDGSRDLDYNAAASEFPKLVIKGGYTNVLDLLNVPDTLNGWSVYCDFSNDVGHSKTTSAKITVTSVAAEATLTPAATAVTAQTGLPVITKHPTDETVQDGGSCYFVAKYTDAKWAVWHFVSPDGSQDLDYLSIPSLFPKLTVKGGYTNVMQLKNIPSAMNGWSVYCDFSNNIGHVKTNWAKITVAGANGNNSTSQPAASATTQTAGTTAQAGGTAQTGLPVITKHPTDETVKVGGSCYFVAKYTDAKWAVWHFVSPDGSRDLDYLSAPAEFPKLTIKGGYTNVMQLKNIPENMNGWTTYCDFSNNAGHVRTDSAKITVTGGTVTATPSPTVSPAASASSGGTVITTWQSTNDLSTAVTGSGVSFSPPVEGAVPDGLSFAGFRYRNGIIEARYIGNDNLLMIRKSTLVSGQSLSADYNVYSKIWNISLKGLTVECAGDGNTINSAAFSSDANFTVSFNAGKEGRGLTADQLNSLVNGMQ